MTLWDLADLCTPWCVHVAATLRIADLIAAGHSEIGDLAIAAGADAESLQRVLRHLVSKGLFAEPRPGVFALNDLARELLGETAVPGFDLDAFGGRMANAWATLLPAVRTGKPAYYQAFGRPFWEDLEANPKIAHGFDMLMGPGHGTPDGEILVNPADWESVRTVVDVGGGTGALLAEVLRGRPWVRGTLVDLPQTVAKSAEVFEAAGVADRVTVAGQSFFGPLPGGADIYVLKNVLADWPDAEAEAILRRCAEAARPSGRVVVFTGALPGEEAGPGVMMMLLLGGKERTFEEFGRLAGRAGLAVSAMGRQKSGKAIVEYRPEGLTYQSVGR
jgi:SAM-dependent methyltransferase